jgi:hypothetical protein
MAGMTRKRWILWLAAAVVVAPIILAVVCYFVFIFPFRNGF